MIARRKFLTVVYYTTVLLSFCFFVFLNPSRTAVRSYDYIAKEQIWDNLFKQTAVNVSSSSTAECKYGNILLEGSTITMSNTDSDLAEGHRIKEGGEYVPSECKAKFSTALIIPYRDRAEQLRRFLVHMHTFLQRQQLHYQIFVVEQLDTKPFNRARLMNVGAKVAMRAGFPCLVLHDVDLLPLHTANLYACTNRPRHMSCSINKFRFVLPYVELFGGAIAILSRQFKAVNGMSNEYFGWGAEDDDLYTRLKAKSLMPCRFDPEISRYYMITHRSQSKGHDTEKNSRLLNSAEDRMSKDGLNSLKYNEVATVPHPLFTHIMVEF